MNPLVSNVCGVWPTIDGMSLVESVRPIESIVTVISLLIECGESTDKRVDVILLNSGIKPIYNRDCLPRKVQETESSNNCNWSICGELSSESPT